MAWDFQSITSQSRNLTNCHIVFNRWSDTWPHAHATWGEVRKDLHVRLTQTRRQCAPDLFLQNQAHKGILAVYCQHWWGSAWTGRKFKVCNLGCLVWNKAEVWLLFFLDSGFMLDKVKQHSSGKNCQRCSCCRKKSVKAHSTTPKGNVGSFQVTVLDLRISGKCEKRSL